jgi:hypothetical protein
MVVICLTPSKRREVVGEDDGEGGRWQGRVGGEAGKGKSFVISKNETLQYILNATTAPGLVLRPDSVAQTGA